MPSAMLRTMALSLMCFGATLLAGCNRGTEGPAAADGAGQTTPAEVTPAPQAADFVIKDPSGYFKPFSDASITRPPESNPVFGTGQTFSFEYDGSKSKEGDSVFYEISYVKPDGAVIRASNGSFDGTTRGVFSTDKKIYDSAADGRPGFIEVSVVQNAKVVGGNTGITGGFLRLGLYPIRIESSK